MCLSEWLWVGLSSLVCGGAVRWFVGSGLVGCFVLNFYSLEQI